MCSSYDSLDLSLEEELLFWGVDGLLGFFTGWLFYNSLTVGALLIVAGGVLALPGYKRAVVRNRKNKLLNQFRDFLYSIASSFSAGRNMTQALKEAQDFCSSTYDTADYILQELEQMVRRIDNANETDLEVLQDFAKRSGLEEISEFVNVYENCKSSGGNMIQAINQATNLIGDEIRMQAELRSLMTQKAFEGRIVAAAPFVIVFLMRMAAPAYMAPMWMSGDGRMVTSFAVALMALGLAITERIARIEF